MKKNLIILLLLFPTLLLSQTHLVIPGKTSTTVSFGRDQNIDFFVNRIHCYFPLTSENLIKMSSTITEISEDILPNEKLDCVVYGCTSGTIAAGYDMIKKKVNLGACRFVREGGGQFCVVQWTICLFYSGDMIDIL